VRKITKNSIIIKRFYWENMRNFESLEVPSKQEEGFDKQAKTSLIQIQNGYGKTTTLYLLRAIFTQTPIPEKHIKGYRYRFSDEKWGGNRDDLSKFFVELEINKEFYRLGIIIDPVDGTQKFTTYTASLGGEVEGWQPPTIFRRLFQGKIEFTNLFLMDGETAREMNREVGAKIVHKSIRQVTNLSNVHYLVGSAQSKGQIDQYVDNMLSQFLGVADGKQAALSSALKVVRDEIDKRTKELIEVTEKVDRQEGKIQQIETEIENLDENLHNNKKRMEIAKKKLNDADGNLKKNTEKILGELHNPSFSFPNWGKIQDFHRSQNKAKLPRSVGSSWFDEILELDNCICGMKWDKVGNMKNHIETHKDDYLDTDLMTQIKEMQNAVLESNSSITIGQRVSLITANQISEAEARQDVEDIRGQASDEDRENYANLNISKGSLQISLSESKEIKEDLGTESKEIIRDRKLDANVYVGKDITVSPVKIRQIKNITCLKIVEGNLKEQLGISEFAKLLQDGAKITKDIIKTMLSDIEKEIRVELEAKMNNSLSGMVGAGIDGGLTVRITESGLNYYNPSGDLQESVNMAAELGGAYAFVSALYNYAEVSIPLVLDTPFAGFGKGMTVNWTQLVPETFDQVIAFINSLEMEGLSNWFRSNENVENYLIRRENEDINTGMPQDGKMILDKDINNFTNYESMSGRDK